MAVAELGLTAAEFWRMTPRAFIAALEHARRTEEARERAAFLRAGKVAVAIYLAGRVTKVDRSEITLADVFPGLGFEQKPQKQSTDEMLASARLWQAYLSNENELEM